MNELIRSFVAIEISEVVRERVADLASRLGRDRAAPIRWVRPDSMHLTLAFLGEVKPAFIEEAKRQLAQVLPVRRRFDVRLSGIGAFPSSRRARVVWVGMDQGTDELCRLQAATVRALLTVGYVPEKRPFSPHLTIGRLKVPADVSAATAVEFSSDAFPVERAVLFQSQLRPTGPVHTQLARFELR